VDVEDETRVREREAQLLAEELLYPGHQLRLHRAEEVVVVQVTLSDSHEGAVLDEAPELERRLDGEVRAEDEHGSEGGRVVVWRAAGEGVLKVVADEAGALEEEIDVVCRGAL